MPPRKSDASKAAAAAGGAAVTGDEGTPAKEVREGINIEDLNLPKSIVTRLAKGVLPPNTQIQGNAMLAMSKSATVFVNNLAYAANMNAISNQRKTINPQDVFLALKEDLEFADFIPRLEAELAKFNEISSEKRNTYRKKMADKATGKTATEDENEEGADRGENGQPAAKKARRVAGASTSTSAGAEQGEEEKENEDEEVEGEGEGEGDVDEEVEDDEVEEEADQDQDPDQDETMEDEEEREGEGADEALDNGEDSD